MCRPNHGSVLVMCGVVGIYIIPDVPQGRTNRNSGIRGAPGLEMENT